MSGGSHAMALEPLRQTLPNGVTLIVKPNATTPAVSVVAGVRAGAYEDPIGGEGTAALAARVLDRGTRERTADDIADELDSRGASLAVATSRHTTTVSATCLAADFAPVLAIVADVLRAPLLDDREVATRRGELMTTIRQEEDDPAAVAVNRLMDDLYGAHPYRRRIRGTLSAVASMTRTDLAAFHQAHFDPAGLVMVVVGDVDPSGAVDRLSAAFGGWSPSREPGPRAPVPDARAAAGRTQITIPMPDKSQTDVVYGFVGIRRSDPDYITASVMNNALGQYAIGGRLGDSIRERQGMAYYVYSSLDAGLGPGPLMIRAGVAASNVPRTIASIDDELTAIRRDGFTNNEIAESKQYLIGALPRQLETNAAIASFLLNAAMLGLGVDYDVRLPGLIQAVTRDEAIEIARRLLDPARATVVVAGPLA
jgi:zinc protease